VCKRVCEDVSNRAWYNDIGTIDGGEKRRNVEFKRKGEAEEVSTGNGNLFLRG
jgi:hypothetical protein